MDLQYTLREYVLQLKNTPRTLLAVGCGSEDHENAL